MVVGAVRTFAFVVSKLFWWIRFRGVENIPREGGLIVVSNHPTYFDPAWISLKIKRPLRFMAWDEAFEWPVIGPLISYLGAFPIKLRSGPAKSSIVESLRTLRDGCALVIFPEGEREFKDGRLHEFKSGAVHIAMNAGVPILPVSIRGGNKVWPQGQKYPRFFSRVDVTYHPPFIPGEQPENVDLDAYLEMVSTELRRTIAEAV